MHVTNTVADTHIASAWIARGRVSEMLDQGWYFIDPNNHDGAPEGAVFMAGPVPEDAGFTSIGEIVSKIVRDLQKRFR